MSDFLTHECGIAVIRLRKPLEYYKDKYGSALWGFNKLFLLMEKQHNRGHDGVGIGCAKLDMPLGQPYIFRRRDAEKDSLATLFKDEMQRFDRLLSSGKVSQDTPSSIKNQFDFGGEILVGHLRYGTSGEFDEGSCHPYLRRSNWSTRTLMVMGNFNMTNTGALNRKLIGRGQHPVFGTDTQTVLEEVGFHLDEAHTDLYRDLREEGVDGHKIPSIISDRIDITKIVSESARAWDGGYAITGIIGNGDMFVMRDPKGIRPCHYYIDDEVIAVASERVPLMTVFEADQDQVSELEPGHVITVKRGGEYSKQRFAEETPSSPCSFEKIYFSRGNDPTIYQERKAMGAALVEQVVKSIDHDFDHAVFSFIPNTAETAYYGLMDGLRLYRREQVRNDLLEAAKEGNLTAEKVDELIMRNWPRGEKIAHKDIKLRTFISQEQSRTQLVSHVYDISYGVVNPGEDVLVMLDDSIVRGTTLRDSILKILSRTRPKKIVICSTAPQIRFPDCYGIDMSQMGKFIAFQAVVALLRRDGKQSKIDEVYRAAKAELEKSLEVMKNEVVHLYEDYTPEEISKEISALVTPKDIEWKGEVELIYQTIEDLHISIEGSCGDWYFTGNYPTQGGVAVANNAFSKWYEGDEGRSYDLPL